MDERDQKVIHQTLHRLVQRYQMSAVLLALARIARKRSFELRDLRDASRTEALKRERRRHASCLENTHKDLQRLAARAARVFNGAKENL